MQNYTPSSQFSRKILFLFFMIATIALIWGCGEDEEPNPIIPTTTSIVGNWLADSATVDGQAASIFTTTNCNPSTVRMEFLFEAGGDFSLHEFDAQGDLMDLDTGTYMVAGTSLDIIIDDMIYNHTT